MKIIIKLLLVVIIYSSASCDAARNQNDNDKLESIVFAYFIDSIMPVQDFFSNVHLSVEQSLQYFSSNINLKGRIGNCFTVKDNQFELNDGNAQMVQLDSNRLKILSYFNSQEAKFKTYESKINLWKGEKTINIKVYNKVLLRSKEYLVLVEGIEKDNKERARMEKYFILVSKEGNVLFWCIDYWTDSEFGRND